MKIYPFILSKPKYKVLEVFENSLEAYNYCQDYYYFHPSLSQQELISYLDELDKTYSLFLLGNQDWFGNKEICFIKEVDKKW